MLQRKKSDEIPEGMEILTADVLTKNDRKTLVQVALAGQPIDSKVLSEMLASGAWWYRTDKTGKKATVVQKMPTLGKSELTANPEGANAVGYTGSSAGDISLNEFLSLPAEKQAEIGKKIQEANQHLEESLPEVENKTESASSVPAKTEDKTAENSSNSENAKTEDKTSEGANGEGENKTAEADKKTGPIDETEKQKEDVNPYQKRVQELADNYNSRKELEDYAKSIGITDPTNKTYKNMDLLAQAIVRKENDLPEDFEFSTNEDSE